MLKTVKLTESQLKTFAWSISVLVLLLAGFAWGSLYDWELSGLDIYQLFPLFGLVAFSLMWTHYIVAAVRLRSGLDSSVTKPYFEATSLVVLISILLHPGLFSWQLFQDGLGVPPRSFLEFGGRALIVPIVIGETALLVFLAYELRRWIRQQKWRRYLQYLSDIAMAGIFVHGLKLGSHLGSGWFRGVWYFYGLTFVLSLVYLYRDKFKTFRA